MKKTLAKLLALSALVAVALLPVGIDQAHAISYNQHYTHGSYPYFGSASYGNRHTYPFNVMFNARHTSHYPWGYEEDDDDNDYWDEDDDQYRRHHYTQTRWYYDDDDVIRPYKYQSGNYYGNNYHDKHRWYDDGYGGREYFEYEHIRKTQYRY